MIKIKTKTHLMVGPSRDMLGDMTRLEMSQIGEVLEYQFRVTL